MKTHLKLLLLTTALGFGAVNPRQAIAQLIQPPGCIPPPTGMVLWLSFDESSGATAQNIAGGNHGTLFNGPAHNPGSYVSNSLCFDGVDDYVEVASYPALDFGTNDFSVDAWVKVNTFDDSIRTIVDHREQSASGIFGFSFYLWFGNTIGFQLADGTFENYLSGLAVPNDGQWHQVAVTVKRGSTTGITFFLDGVAGAQANPTSHPGSLTPAAPVPLRVGGHLLFQQNLGFNGCLDEVELFNRELTPAEIAGLYNAGSAGKCKTNLPATLPVITRQPQSLTVTQGQNAKFIVEAVGAPPLSYQWFFNGAALPGATLAELNLGPAEPSSAGNYSVVVSNPFGVVTSQVATLTLGGGAPDNGFHVWVGNAAALPVVQAEIERLGGVIAEASLYFLRLSFTSDPAVFAQIAALPSVLRAEPAYEPGLFNYNSRFAINALKVQAAPYGLGGLTGALVVAGVWDGGTFGLTHPDYLPRLTVMENCPPNFLNDIHAAHVIGTMAGNGSSFKNSLAGVAPDALIKDWSFLPCGVGFAAPTPQTEMLNARDIVGSGWPAPKIDLSQNSWGYVPNVCSLYGSYIGFCADYDQLVRQETLPIFFAAGNSQAGLNASTLAPCFAAGFGGFGTVLPIGTAKNVVTVGAIDVLNTLTVFSSCGPTADGRLKPDVVALGDNVFSTTDPWWQGTGYFALNGTSMATPAVSGTAALLIEQYRKLSLPDPSPALLKALFCNTATDLGNAGPDFQYGYGKVNAEKAVDTIVNKQFVDVTSGGLATGGVWTHAVKVPQGCELRVTLAWSDVEYLGPNPQYPAKTLINDLDLELVDPSSGIQLPLTLNPSSPATAALPAVPAVNTRDNVEQVVIAAAQGGVWTIVVKGSNVPQGPQEFAVTWCVVCPPACQPQPIKGLWNTGFDTSGFPLPIGVPDPHYALIFPPTPFTDARRNIYGGWLLPDGPSSFWIEPGPPGNAANGIYIYELTFDLGTCDPNTASITGQWAADDWAELRINNVPVPGVNAAYRFGLYGQWTPLSITSGFITGVNTIQFVAHNLFGHPTGLRVELSGTVCCDCIKVPPHLPDMVAWWPLDEPAGAVTYAELVNKIQTSIQSGPLGPPLATSGPQAVPGKVAGGSCFPRSFTYGQANASQWLNFVPPNNGNGSFSLDCWAMLPVGFAGPFHTIVDKLQTSLAGYKVGINSAGEVELQIGNGTIYTRTSTGLIVPPSVWTFVGVTVDRSTPNATVTFYVNGASVTAPTILPIPLGAGSTFNNLTLLIGGNGVAGVPPAEICLDEVELFSRVLTPVEMTAIFTADSDGKCKPCLPIPANDDCAKPIPLAVNGPPVCGTTLCATPTPSTSVFSPAPCGGTLLSNDVWFSVVALCSGTMTVNTCEPCLVPFPQPDIDTVLSAYLMPSNPNCSPLTQVSPTACDDDSCGPSGWNSQITFPVTAGQTYLLRVADGSVSPGGWFAIQATQTPGAPPPNDFCANAIVLPANTPTPGTTICAMPSVTPPSPPGPNFIPTPCGNSASTPDVWYTFTPPCNGPVTIDTCALPGSGAFDTVLSVYTGNCGSLILGPCNDNALGPCGNRSKVIFIATGGTPYRVRVSGAAGAVGNFIINVTAVTTPPPNDNVANAIPVTAGSPAACGWTICATPSPTGSLNPPPACTLPGNPPDVWYTFLAVCNGPVTVDTCGLCPGQPNGFNTVLSVYTGPPPFLTQVPGACNDDAVSGPCPNSARSFLTFNGVMGTIYYIRVADSILGPAPGYFRLNITAPTGPPPPNDFCSAAKVIPLVNGVGTDCGTTICATPSSTTVPGPNFIPSACVPASAGAPDVWYKFTPPCSRTFRVETCGNCNNTITSFDTVLSVFADPVGLGCGVLMPIACNDDAPLVPPFCGSQSRLLFNGTAGVTYYLRVAGKNGVSGNFQLTVTAVGHPLPPPNDLCANATVVVPGTYPWGNCNANTDGPGSSFSCPVVPENDVWFSYTPACAGTVWLSTCQSKFDTVLAVYSGSCPPGGSLVPISCNDDAPLGASPCGPPQSYLSFPAAANTTYLIRAGGKTLGNTGGGLLTIVGPNPPLATCPPLVGTPLTRWFRVMGPPNGTPWAWRITASCCATVCVQQVTGVNPGLGVDANTLAQEFVKSINGACGANSGLSAMAFPGFAIPGIFKVVVNCTPWQLAVGPANTPCDNLCVVPSTAPPPLGTQLPVTGPCSFNPDIIGLAASGEDGNTNGIDDGVEITLGATADLNDNLIPDEIEACLGPQLALNPEPQVVHLGDNVSLSVAASGTAPFTYQWLRNDVPLSDGGHIAGATNAALSITGVTEADLGTYTVAISNACDGALSAPADVTLVPVLVPVLYDLQLSADGFQFTFDTLPAVDYVVEYKNDLNEAAWTQLATVPGIDGPIVIYDPEPRGQMRFYRVRRLAP